MYKLSGLYQICELSYCIELSVANIVFFLNTVVKFLKWASVISKIGAVTKRMSGFEASCSSR